MKNIIIIILLSIIALLIAQKATADWQRLQTVDDYLWFAGGSPYRMQIIYDKVEHVNCYVLPNAMSCMKAK